MQCSSKDAKIVKFCMCSAEPELQICCSFAGCGYITISQCVFQCGHQSLLTRVSCECVIGDSRNMATGCCVCVRGRLSMLN